MPGEVVLLVLLVVAYTIIVVYGKTTTAKIGIGFPSLVYITCGSTVSGRYSLQHGYCLLVYRKLVLKSLEIPDMVGVVVINSRLLDCGIGQHIIPM